MNAARMLARKMLWTIFGLAVCTSSAAATERVTLYLTNALGTPVAEMDAAGNVTYTAANRPYGKQEIGASQTGPGFTGHVNDPDTGLVYMQARYYDSDSTRFISIDPVGVQSAAVFSMNRYLYANGNPVNSIDPSGAFSCEYPFPCDGQYKPAVHFTDDDNGSGGDDNSGSEGSDNSSTANNTKISYQSLESNYPGHGVYPTDPTAPNSIWSLIGGHVLMNAWSSQRGSDGSFLPNNTCAIRMSYALNASGLQIPRTGNSTISGENRLWYFYRVRDLQAFLTTVLGEPQRLPGGSFAGPTGQSGIISFNIPFRDATGHFSLWDGHKLIDRHEPYQAWPKPTSALFWRVQ